MAKKSKGTGKQLIWAIVIIVFVILFVWLYPRTANVCFKEKCFQVEVEESDRDRAIGLMYRDTLSQDKGMLFAFDYEDRHSFWMRNTIIPLDIIWMDKDGKVVYIKENAEPCKESICESFKSETSALYVLEVNNGQVKETGLKVGDNVLFKLK